MAIADNKKCQTLINIVAKQVELLKAVSQKLQKCRQAYQDQNVSPAGTPLEGNVPAISGWIDDIESVANDVIANGFLAHVVSGHENNALGEL